MDLFADLPGSDNLFQDRQNQRTKRSRWSD